MKINKIAGIVLGFTLLFGVGLGSIAAGYAHSQVGNRNQDRRTWDSYPNWGGSFDLRQTALNAGFNEGSKEGRKDRANGRQSNFEDFSAYQKATKDYSTRLGDRELYRRYFREAFQRGYNTELQTTDNSTYYSSSRLTGTFRLDPSRSDNPREVADRVTRNLNNNERQGESDRVLARLESPEILAIDRRGSTITLASSLAPQSTFQADGIERQEQLSGRTSRVTATLRGDQLAIKTTGYRNSDSTVTFEPIENGRRLRVRREIYSDRYNQPIVVNSIYNRTSDVAQWNVYDGSRPGDTGVTDSTYYSSSRLTGTFRLDPSRSDNPREVADRVTRNVNNNERQGVSDRVLARLESPEVLAIDRRGSTITLASSLAPQATFEADGIERQEQLSGRTSRVTASLRGDQLAIKTTGYRNSDFTVTFEPIENGRRLRVRREIYSDRYNQPIVVNSIYNRTSDVAQWNVYDGSRPGDTRVTSGEFIVRDGETVVAVLNNDLTTDQAKQGDRFTMTVREPAQYEGAVIEGTVGSVDKGGRLTGRSAMVLNFDTIRLRNGRTYGFAGVLGSVRTPNGETVKVDNEGTAQADNQTTQTVQRTAIGTAVGAIIGAIAGGGKGAAIGAIIGAAGGAGSVYVQGKDNLELPSGTEITIRSSAPAR
jgi:hypothetical protein